VRGARIKLDERRKPQQSTLRMKLPCGKRVDLIRLMPCQP
jgi:hypothetical protein